MLFALALAGALAVAQENELTFKIDRTSLKSTAYVDIKSEGLRDILRIILKDIKWLSLGEDKPAVSPIMHAPLGFSQLIGALG